MDSNLHSPDRRLIELSIEHADLDALIDRAVAIAPLDELSLRRLKKRRLALRDEMQRIRDRFVARPSGLSAQLAVCSTKAPR